MLWSVWSSDSSGAALSPVTEVMRESVGSPPMEGFGEPLSSHAGCCPAADLVAV